MLPHLARDPSVHPSPSRLIGVPVKAAKRRLPGVAVLILTVFGATQFIVVDRPVVDVVLKLPRNIIVGRVEKPDKPVNLVAPAGWRVGRDSNPR